MKPYYEHDGQTIYLGDCRLILPELAKGCSVCGGSGLVASDPMFDGPTPFHCHAPDCRKPLKVDLVLTDPPYGTNNDCDYTRFTGGQRVNAALRQGRVHPSVHGDSEPFDPSFIVDFPNVILWGANNYAHLLPAGSWLVWDKKNDGLEGKFMSDCEVAWCKGGCGVFLFRHVWDGFNRDSERGLHCHPTQKPVALMTWCLKRKPNAATILDPFLGSGTTLRACKDLGRRGIGIEIEERYCEIAARRLDQGVLNFTE